MGRCKMKPYVYFIRNGHGSVKIGVTANPEGRVFGMSSANDTPLELIRTVEGGRQAEAWLHARFADLRLHGEWFRFVPEMMTAEADLTIPDGPTRDARCGPRIPLDVYQGLAAEGKSQSEIAQALGISRQAVHQAASRYGIEIKNGRAAADTTHDAEVIRLAEAGKTAMEIASVLGINSGKVRIILGRHSLKANKPAPKSKYADALRGLAASGASLADAARALGVHQPAAHKMSVKLGIKFADGRKRKKDRELAE
jgi:DNA-binding CsgD family transcriptional regulator